MHIAQYEPFSISSHRRICMIIAEGVNSSPLDKMAAILADNIFNCIFLNENDRI